MLSIAGAIEIRSRRGRAQELMGFPRNNMAKPMKLRAKLDATTYPASALR